MQLRHGRPAGARFMLGRHGIKANIKAACGDAKQQHRYHQARNRQRRANAHQYAKQAKAGIQQHLPAAEFGHQPGRQREPDHSADPAAQQHLRQAGVRNVDALRQGW
jgi:hypothetical protein